MMREPQVWTQRRWQDHELRALGFARYETQRQIRMARLITQPGEVDITKEKLEVDAGYMLCYNPGTIALPNLKDYDQWPVRFDLFHQNYQPWPTEGWQPNPAEKHLMENGCKPYYKATSVWAKRLKKRVYVQSLESKEPIAIPPGYWLCIGAEGEPYHMRDAKFRDHYIAPPVQPLERIYWSIMRRMGGAE
ncbi:MAG TPA: hypothetical protein VKY59_16685 [Spirillospora sp.]|nr:hypothetical protein [Spirillospora sp.]